MTGQVDRHHRYTYYYTITGRYNRHDEMTILFLFSFFPYQQIDLDGMDDVDGYLHNLSKGPMCQKKGPLQSEMAGRVPSLGKRLN